jgi:TonB family protein
VLFIVRPSRTIMVPGPDVVQVALLGDVPPAPPPPVVKANDAVVPDESDGVRIEKPRPKPKPEVKQQPKPTEPVKGPPRAEPAPPSAAPRTVLPYADMGGGVAGQVAVDDASFEFSYYLQMVRAQIGRNWVTPAGAASGTRAEVYFRVGRSGEILGLRLAVSSGNEYFDQSALRAVQITEQLPPLPLGWARPDLGIQYGFEFTGP